MKYITTIIASLLLTTSISLAAEVYIDQVGGDLTIDILQENGMNRLNSEADPAIVNGDGINLLFVQSGDQNEADLYFDQNSNDTDYTYNAVGSFNIVITSIFGGINNYFSSTVTGDTNNVSACKDLYNTVCNGIIVNNTQNILDITGNNNEINFALDSSDSINNISIGQNIPSDFNVVNVTQTNGGFHMATITIDGNTNLVDLIQN